MSNGNDALGFRLLVGALVVLSGVTAAAPSAMAASPAMTFGVSLTIGAACTVSAPPIAFAAQNVRGSPASLERSVSVTCSNPSPYAVEIDARAGAVAAVTNRLMTDPAATAGGYRLYQATVRF